VSIDLLAPLSILRGMSVYLSLSTDRQQRRQTGNSAGRQATAQAERRRCSTRWLKWALNPSLRPYCRFDNPSCRNSTRVARYQGGLRRLVGSALLTLWLFGQRQRAPCVFLALFCAQGLEQPLPAYLALFGRVSSLFRAVFSASFSLLATWHN
jgi:hypothetical protein